MTFICAVSFEQAIQKNKFRARRGGKKNTATISMCPQNISRRHYEVTGCSREAGNSGPLCLAMSGLVVKKPVSITYSDNAGHISAKFFHEGGQSAAVSQGTVFSLGTSICGDPGAASFSASQGINLYISAGKTIETLVKDGIEIFSPPFEISVMSASHDAFCFLNFRPFGMSVWSGRR